MAPGDEAMPVEDRREANAHMLQQDVDLGIMPIGGRSRSRPDFAIKLLPDDKPTIELLIEALGDNHPREDLPETVCDFVRDVASSLVWEGRALYEVVWGPQHPVDATRRRLFLAPFPTTGVERRGGSYTQRGRVLSMKTGHPEVRTATIPERDVLDVRLPRFLGEARLQPRFLGLLGRMHPYPPDWVLQEWARRAGNSGYAFDVHRREMEILVARITRPWGWDKRWAWGDYSLEYFQVFRTLSFRRTLARLREHIIGQVNSLLMRVDYRASMDLVGLPSSTEIDEVIAQLQAGRIDFRTAMERTSVS